MSAAHSRLGKFEKVGECLFRYSSSGVYYAFVRHERKLFRESLETTDKAFAKRKLAEFRRKLGRVDSSAAKITLAVLCDRYLATVQNQAPKTVRRKTDIVTNIKADWPGGSDVKIRKIRPSDISTWLALYDFGWASQHLYLECIRAILDLAVADKIILESPARSKTIKRKKKEKPIRLTPSHEDFLSILKEIRAQKHNADALESADFLEFQGLAGLGQAEAAALRWADIDWQTGRITTFRHKTRQRFHLPLYPQLRPLLERRKGSKAPGPDELVFKIKDAKKALSAACKRLSLPSYSQRAMRRMFVTRAIQKGVDVKSVAEWQGHKDGGKLILDTYSHVFSTHSDKMAGLMNE